MLNNIYVVYNRLSCRYGAVVCYPTDSFAVSRVLEENPSFTRENDLCRVATISIVDGTVIPCAPVRVDFEVSSPLPVKEDK